MAIVDHVSVSVIDVPRSAAQFGPLLGELGFERDDAPGGSVSWWREGEPEIILMPARHPEDGPHRHGDVGWQHLAFEVGSRAEVERLHAIARAAGWTEVRAPKEYPRFTESYYAAFVEDASGIRIEFMHNPPGEQFAHAAQLSV